MLCKLILTSFDGHLSFSLFSIAFSPHFLSPYCSPSSSPPHFQHLSTQCSPRFTPHIASSLTLLPSLTLTWHRTVPGNLALLTHFHSSPLLSSHHFRCSSQSSQLCHTLISFQSLPDPLFLSRYHLFSLLPLSSPLLPSVRSLSCSRCTLA